MRTLIITCLIVLLNISGGLCQQEDVIVWKDFMNRLQIEEGLPTGKEIATLVAVFKATGTSDGIVYGFNDKSSANDNSFSLESNGLTVDTNSGVVSIQTPLDFDGVLNYNTGTVDEQLSNFDIGLIAKGVYQGTEYFKRVQGQVFLTNLNDVTPQFINNSIQANIVEEEAIPSGGLLIVENIMVVDVDSIFTNQRKLLVTIQSCVNLDEKPQCPTWFRLEYGRTNDRIVSMNLYLVESLDFETEPTFQVQLLATDGKQRSNTDVVITVDDIQDQKPEWVVIPATTNINDSTPVGILKVTVLAEDQDSETIKRDVQYEIIPGQTNRGIAIDKVFKIDKITGVVTNIVPLDLEDPTYFKKGRTTLTKWPIVLIACEVTTDGIVTTDCTPRGNIEININDINDNGPKFNRALYRYTIREDIINGAYVNNPAIDINDLDMEGFNEYNTIIVTPSNEFALIGNDSNPILIVKDSSLIDYDRGPKQYTLQLRTFDLSNPNYFAFADVIIDVTDVNDIIPEFTETDYLAFIPETAPEGFFVIDVVANDIDSGLFGKQGIRYDFAGGYKNLFQIDEITGTISVAFCPTYGTSPCLDYDSLVNSYTFTVYATDYNAQPGSRQGSASLVIQLLKVNDNPPEVGDYSVSIFELQREFISPLIIQGTDPDEGTTLIYSIASQVPGNFWKIDSSSGEITLNKPFPEPILYDDARNGGFDLVVDVSDGLYQTSSNVKITVIDVNDKPPRFLPDYYEIAINESTPGNTFLLTLLATDQDDPTSPNGQLVFLIESGNPGGTFILDKNNPRDLKTAPDAELDFNAIKLYNLTVRVDDRGAPQLSDLAIVIIHILDENNKNPQIDPFLQRFTIFESLGVNSEFGFLTATDQDANAKLEYRFTDKRGANSINGFPVDFNTFDYRNLFRISLDGKLYVNAPLDAVKANIITYSVEVEDVSAPTKQTGPGTLVIVVKRFNSRPPVFIDLPTNITVREERPFGTVIASIIATDENGISKFSIGQQPDDIFTISPASGAVQIIGRIDYDDARLLNSSSFEVVVADRGDPQLTSSASIQVFFTNINDNYPQFVRGIGQSTQRVNLYTATIPENSPDGTPVVQVFTIDKDRPDENGFHLVRYYMFDDRFDVNEFTGEVFVRLRNGEKLDREAVSRVLALVIARDNPNKTNDEPQLQRAASISITLTDVNDNPPVFSNKEFYVAIFETTPLDPGNILQLFISDQDLGENAVSIFTKIPNQGDDFDDLFGVRPQLGQVYIKKNLKGRTGLYNFFVQAQDKIGTGFISNVSVVVEVRPSANSPPIWVIPPRDNMTIFVLEEQYNGMLVYDVSANDLDAGDNGVVEYSFIYEGETTQATPEFKINLVTGVIQAEINYDRERVDRYVLLLKAADRGETKLETTRFLTIIVKDVNDNVPTFPLDEVEITVQENVNVSSNIGQVIAEDLDLNPIIKYQIISGNEEGVFTIDEDTGEIFLAKQLNTEVKSIYYIQVQATNEEADYTVIRSRRKRAIDPSIVTVKIIVGDVNDLAPVFLEDRYYGCISTRSQFGKHILSVTAVDRDAIGTGIVRYTVNKTEEGGRDVGNNFFTIHPKYGIVTNTVLMTKADKTFDLTVNARDGLDPAESESSNTNVKVFVTQPGKEVKLLITQNSAEVRLYQSQIQSIIEQSSNIDYLCILDVQDHKINSLGSTGTFWSDVYVSGIRMENDGTFNILGSRELTNVINYERTNRKNDFDLLYIKEVEAASSSNRLDLDDKAVIIILIIIAVLIFLVIIFCIVAFMCIKAAKTQKKQRLVHKTNSPPPAPVIMAVHDPEPEPVIYDNRAYIQDPEPQVIEQQEVITPQPVHVQYAVVQKRSPSPVQYETEYYTSNTVDDEVIVVPLNDDYQQPSVYEPQQEDDGEVYRIETEIEQM